MRSIILVGAGLAADEDDTDGVGIAREPSRRGDPQKGVILDGQQKGVILRRG